MTISEMNIGDTVTAACAVMSLKPVKNIAGLEAVCSNQKGGVVIQGTAIVVPPKAC